MDFFVFTGFVLVTWSRFWLKASEQPFGYTCSLEKFQAVTGAEDVPSLGWLDHDIAQSLAEARREFTTPSRTGTSTAGGP